LLVLLVGMFMVYTPPASTAWAARLEGVESHGETDAAKVDPGGGGPGGALWGLAARFYELLEALGLTADGELGPTIDPSGVEVDSTSSTAPPSGVSGGSGDLTAAQQP
jgi:hypothetical protein